MPRRPALLLTALLLVGLTACGGDEEQAPEPAPDEAAGAFPVTIEHEFGSTTVPSAPQRVVTVGFNESDFALAFDVVPVGVRDFIGTFPEETRPWAAEQLDGAQPPLVGGDVIDFEAVAALEPDLILGVYSFIEQSDYDLLEQIAPTVAQPAGYEPGGTPWQEQTRVTGLALGQPERAEEVVAAAEESFTRAAAEHPEFADRTLALDLALDGVNSILDGSDLRTQFFTELGFQVPAQTGSLSGEQVGLLDQDVLVVLGESRAALLADPLIAQLPVVQEERAVFFGDFGTPFAGALGFSSPLSLPFAVEEALPRLVAATDDDPATVPEAG